MAEVELLKGKKNILYSEIGKEEKDLRQLESEKNKMIQQKSIKQASYAEKQRELGEREYMNQSCRQAIEAQRKLIE